MSGEDIMKKRNQIQANVSANRCERAKVVDCVEGNIGPKNTRACIQICGIPFDDNAAFYKELYLLVKADGCCKRVELKPGYNPKVMLFDFNGAGNDIYVTIDSGGSGGFQYFYIFEYKYCNLNLLMSDDLFNAQYNNYMGYYIDYFRAQVVDREDVWRIDLSCKGSEYLSQIYYEDGKLIEPKDIYISGANYTYPQYTQYLDRYTLVVYQKITGLYQADTLGYMETTLKFDGSNHEVESIYLKTFSDEMMDCIVF